MRNQKLCTVSAAFLFLFLGLFVAPTYAQRLTGNVRGTVMDETRTPLSGVTVEISSPELMGGGTLSQVTDEKGLYRFVNLPPGIYKLVFKLQGFQTAERPDTQVSVKGTVTEDIILKQATLENTVTVSGEAPIIDVTSSGMSTNFDKSLLEKLPAGRNSFLDVVKQTPGLTTLTGYSGNSLMSAFGSNNESNAFQIDGLDISNPRQGDTYLLPNQDLFTEVEVSGIGAPAEYGSFSGAVVNIVTKSGGNVFSGSVSYYGQYKALTGNNNPTPGESYSYDRHKFLDAGFTLGGPIVKDKLWFFASVNVSRDDATLWLQDPEYHAATKEDGYYFKASYQISSNHKLVGVIAYRDWARPEVPTPYLTEEATRLFRSKVPNWNLMYTWQISPNTYLELKTAGYKSKDDGLNQHGSSLDDPVHIDLLTGIQSNAPLWPYYASYSRVQAHASISHFAEDFLGGDHEFKMGVQFNRGEHGSICAYSGGKLYYDYGGAKYLLYQQAPFYYGGRVDNLGAFFDDSWKMGKRLTLNIGLRYDHYNGTIPSFDLWEGWHKVAGQTTPGISNLIVWNVFSPRLGVAYQLTSDGKTVLKAQYGRYYEPLFVGTFEFPGPNTTDWSASYWDGSHWVQYNYYTGSFGWSVASNLKAPVSDQVSASLEREIIPNFSIGLTGIYKKQKNPVAFINAGGKYELISVVSPDNGQTYQVYNQLNVGENEYVLGNPKGFGQTYKGLILSLNKRFSHNWLLNSSLTWSRSEGLTTISPSTDMNQIGIIATTSFNTGRDPNDWLNARGLMQFDRPWVFKLQGSYSFPWGIMASANFQSMSGRPYTSKVRVSLAQGVRAILSAPRDGSRRFSPLTMLDLRLQKSFSLHRNFKMNAMFDLFNVFNTNTALNYQSYYEWSTAYLQASQIAYPRRVQLGLKFEF